MRIFGRFFLFSLIFQGFLSSQKVDFFLFFLHFFVDKGGEKPHYVGIQGEPWGFKPQKAGILKIEAGIDSDKLDRFGLIGLVGLIVSCLDSCWSHSVA